MDTSIMLNVLSSTVVAALISAFVSILTHNKSNKLKYITEERQKWRRELRAAAIALRRIGNNERERDEEKGRDKKKEKERDDANEIRFKTVAEAKTFFQVRLNPYDKEDMKLLRLIREEKDGRISADDLDELSKAISWLLKHDWERVKLEASSLKLAFIFKLILILLITFLSFMLVSPSMFYNVIHAPIIDTTYIKSISLLYVFVLILLLVVVSLSLMKLDYRWRHYKEKLTNSNREFGKFLREILDIPLRKKIKNREKKHGKNN
ncbi:MAG: hypothetical protein PHQ81_03860 [Methanofollis sp.]|nr:hypothetical protein [Methanofollis sp.]